MMGYCGGNIDVTHSVTVGAAKCLVADVFLDSFDSATRHGIVSRINHCHAPWFGILMVHFYRITRHIKGNIRHVEEVIGEVFLNDVALVTAANHEVIDTVGARVRLQGLPLLCQTLSHRG